MSFYNGLSLKMPDIMKRCLGQDIRKRKRKTLFSFLVSCNYSLNTTGNNKKKSINKNCTLHIQSSGADRAEVCMFWACTVLIFWKEFLLQRTKQKLTNKYCAGQMRCLDLVQWKKADKDISRLQAQHHQFSQIKKLLRNRNCSLLSQFSS